jgi:hypothetical protein
MGYRLCGHTAAPIVRESLLMNFKRCRGYIIIRGLGEDRGDKGKNIEPDYVIERCLTLFMPAPGKKKLS